MYYIFILCIIIGLLHGGHVMRQTRQGKLPGTPEQKTFFDWLFYNNQVGD